MLRNSLTLAAALTLIASADPTTPAKAAPEAATPPTEQATKKKPKLTKEERQAARKKRKEALKAAEKTTEAKKDAPKAKVADEKPAPADEAKPAPADHDAEIAKAKAEQERLSVLNALAAEKQKFETAELRAEIARIKLEKELLNEKIALAAAKNGADAETVAKYAAEKEKLTREATLAKLSADKLANNLKAAQTESALSTTAMMAEISAIETKDKRDNYANAEPQYLDDPLKPDGTLVISDRRIPFNGPVTSALADRVTTRINYFNNKDPKKPIFIVIDDSPGGSVMAGYRILKAMEGSEAPVYVVVKSFAASMAASVTTLAERSFVYPNAMILHHQISQGFMLGMNLTEQKENLEDLKKWWARLADPISAKMGITSDEFIEMMYEKTVSGDWTEFGDEAVKLKWADHVVTRIHETSLLKNPDAKEASASSARSAAIENGALPAVDEHGNPYMILPRPNPKDVYMMHNPDGFYRFK